jgi:membrane-associated phospholipid phosphatase
MSWVAREEAKRTWHTFRRDWVATPRERRKRFAFTLTYGWVAAFALMLGMTFGLQAVYTPEWESAERAWLERMVEASPIDHGMAVFFESPGNGVILIPLVTILSIAFARRRQPLVAVAVAASCLLVAVVVGTGWAVWDRQRPAFLYEGLPEGTLSSFPSGHMSMSIPTYGFLIYLWLRGSGSWAERVFGVFLLLLSVAVLAKSRIVLSAHWPTDLVAGAVLGAFWLVVVIRALRRGEDENVAREEVTARRERSERRAHARELGMVVALLAGSALPLAAQLRPLEPVDWTLLRGAGTASLRVGAGVHHGQKASLAGLEGRLVEAGEVRAGWVSGRVMIEAGGTVRRLFDGYERYAEPTGGALPASGGRLDDRGAWRVGTVIRLTEAEAPALFALRFGTRLPNPDNHVGLDRDQTDFFALVGGHVRRAGLSLGAEAGLGINGTRDPEYEQSDVVLYTAVAEFRRGAFAPRLALVGQYDGNRRAMLRGNEDLGEVRLGLRAGGSHWIELDVVRGLVPFSPSTGVLVAAGLQR